MKRIGLVTCRELPEPDHDEALLLAALREAGMAPSMLAWDDPEADPSGFDLCVLRSCWNYFEDPVAFAAWIEKAASVSTLLNPVDVVRWNTHKSYLHAMEASGVPIVPTEWLERGAAADLGRLMQARGWNEVVIKPAVSAGSFGARRFAQGELDEGQVFLDASLRARDTMVQLFMPSFDAPGERALVWIDGELTHAVIKRPRFHDDDERVSTAQPITEEDRAVAASALACVDGDLLYARVDVVDDGGGNLVVSELELIEPSLFLLQYPPALARFVSAIAARARA